MSHEQTALAIGDSLPIVKLLLENSALVPVIVADAEAIGNAGAVGPRWVAIKKLGDDLEPILAQLIEAHGTPMKATAADVEALGPVGKNGQIITILIQNLPQILSFITQIIPLFKAPQTA